MADRNIDRGRSERGGDDRGRSRGADDRGRGRDRDDDRPSSRGRDRDSRGDDRGRGDRERSRDDERPSSRSSGSGRSYVYERRDDGETRDRANKGAKDFDKILKEGVKMFKVNDGDNTIRILPPTWAGAKHYGLDIFVHYGIGPDRNSYLDLDKMKGEPDPITEERVLAQRDGDEKYAKELDSKRRVLVYLIDRKNPKEGVQAWAMPWTVDRDIIKVSQDKQTREVLPIDDPENGYDIEFEKKGTGDRTEYLAVQVARRSSSLGQDEWLDYAMDNPLPAQLNYYDYDHIAKAFGGGGGQKDNRDSGEGERQRDRGDDRSDRDRPSSRGRDEPKGPALSWASVHDMTARELEDLIEDQHLDIDPKEAKDDEDLADWICDELKLKKEEPASRERSRGRDDDRSASESTSERLARLRREG